MEQTGTLPAAPAQKPASWIKRIDPAWAIAVLIALGLGIADPKQLPQALLSGLKSFAALSPLMLITFSLNGFVKAADATNAVMRIFEGRLLVTVVAATLVGSLSHLCSCTVIPMIVVLLQARVPLAPIVSFWMASPIVSPDTYAMTAGVLGFRFANARVISALCIGIFSGLLTALMVKLGFFKQPMHPRLLLSAPKQNITASSGKVKAVWKFWKEPARMAVFKQEFWNSARTLSGWLMVAFLLEAVMMLYVPNNAIIGWFGSGNNFSIPLAAAVGVPLYVNGVQAVPVAEAFLHAGMSEGATLAFIVGGAVTAIPAMMAVFPIVKRPVFAWYLFLCAVAALGSGYGYQLVLHLMGR